MKRKTFIVVLFCLMGLMISAFAFGRQVEGKAGIADDVFPGKNTVSATFEIAEGAQQAVVFQSTHCL